MDKNHISKTMSDKTEAELKAVIADKKTYKEEIRIAAMMELEERYLNAEIEKEAQEEEEKYKQQAAKSLKEMYYIKMAPLMAVIVAVFWAGWNLYFIHNSTLVEGKVIGYRFERIHQDRGIVDTGYERYLEFEFEYKGKQYQDEAILMTNIQISNGIGEDHTYVEFFDIGEAVEVCIANDNPKDFRLNTFEHLWRWPLFIGALGGFISCINFLLSKLLNFLSAN